VVILLDTSFLYIIFNKSDPHNERGIKILNEIEKLKYGQPIITDYIFDELLTLTLNKLGKSFALKVLNGLIELLNNGLELFFINEDLFEKAVECFIKYELSFTDCTSVALLLAEKESYIASLDKGFDRVKGIVRIY